MVILGISAFFHDSSACLLIDGEISCACQEERFTRVKHDSSFPVEAIRCCIAEAAIDPHDIDLVVFYEKPFLKFERLIETYLAFAPRGFTSFAKAMPSWIKEKLFLKRMLRNQLELGIAKNVPWEEKILFSNHHLSHAASAFYPSPFESAAVLTLDGVGEWTTTSLYLGQKEKLHAVKEIRFPHSLGLLYSAFTYYTGFKVNSGEYKVMGLAPYGEPRFLELIEEHLICVAEDGSFQLDMSYFDFATGLTMTNRKFHDLFGAPPRSPETQISQRDMDLAASIQKVTERVILRLAKSIAEQTGEKNLCLAGGVALNCVANGMLVREKLFENIWIQPAAGDAGGALGAALAVWHMHLGNTRTSQAARDDMRGAFLGPAFDETRIEADLEVCNAVYQKLETEKILDLTAQALSEGNAVGWMQGRMEFGPRALGGRSIIADPRSPKMQRQLNLKVKYRESFRPFAPSVLAEEVGEWFEHSGESPYMLIVAGVQNHKRLNLSEDTNQLFGLDKLNVARSLVPAVTHVDYSARIQTVHQDTNPKYHRLISLFYEKTGCPMVVNTSFNVRGEPIVCSPLDAFNCFMGTDLDVLVIEDFILYKSQQDQGLAKDYKNRYSLD